MTHEQPTDSPGYDSSPANRRRLRQERIAWWFRYLSQPLILAAVIVGLVIGLGIAQRSGWLSGPQTQETTLADAGGEELLYICPMVCVAPTQQPGQCPVCGMDLKAQQATDSGDRYGLTLDPASIRVANIRTVTAESATLPEEIGAIGEISPDEGTLATITAWVDGRIEKLFADFTGVTVKPGEVLALVYSPQLYSSQVAFAEALKLVEADRQRTGTVSDSNQRFFNSTRQRLIEMGMTEEQVAGLAESQAPDSRIRIVSPVGGTVMERLVDEGQYVESGQEIARVADLSRVWLMLELFPRDASRIRFGQRVVTRIQSLPGREFTGRVAFVDPVVQPGTRTVRVRVVIPNHDGLIRIGDLATATISVTSADTTVPIHDPELAGKWISPRHPHVVRDAPGECPVCGLDLVPAATMGFSPLPVAIPHQVIVPRSAVLMAGDVSVAYVETEPGRFEFRRVGIGRISGDRISIVSGIEAGEQVVDSAALLVDSQFNMAGKPSLIDPARALPDPPLPAGELDEQALHQSLSGFSEADRQAVLRQKVCPVGNLPLGSMGPPVRVEIQGRPVFLCCEACRGPLQDDPGKYLPRLPEPAASPDPASPENTGEPMRPADPSAEANALPRLAPPDPNQAPLPRMEPPGDSTGDDGDSNEPPADDDDRQSGEPDQ